MRLLCHSGVHQSIAPFHAIQNQRISVDCDPKGDRFEAGEHLKFTLNTAVRLPALSIKAYLRIS